MSAGGCGTVFELAPPTTTCRNTLCSWIHNILYTFTGGNDGGYPGYGYLVFDQAGNIYGETGAFGPNGQGTVYQLTSSGGSWTESVLYSFSGGADGESPQGGVIFDPVGNLYGTTVDGGFDENGTVFQLSPTGADWTQSTLYTFGGGSDGQNPVGGVIFDQSGNLYGTTQAGGGTVYQLSPSNGAWALSTLQSLSGSQGPTASLTMDASGNLYGTATEDGSHGYGVVFKLSPNPDGSWTYTDLHDFAGGGDGMYPTGNVILDSNGNLYSTTVDGGAHGYGTVWELTP